MQKIRNNGFIISIVKGALFSLIATLIGILIFALILRLSALSSSVVKPVNQFIKVISLFIGCYFTVKGEKGLVKGLLTGILYTVLTYLVFALIGGANFNGAFFIDLIFTAIMGIISGIICVNIKKNR